MRILLIEDHPIVRSGCRRLLQSREDIDILEASTGAEGLDLSRDSCPELIVVDLCLPDIKGLEVLRMLLIQDPEARILVFTMYEDTAFVSQALNAGARGYITKSDDPEALLAAVDAISRGMIYLGPTIAQKSSFANLSGSRDSTRPLSPRELEIFTLLGRGLSFGEIATQLAVSYKTVANMGARIKEKMGLHTTVALVKAAVERGQAKNAGSDGSHMPARKL